MTPLSALHSLAFLLPFLSVGARRLHDLEMSGWWFPLFPIMMGLLLVVDPVDLKFMFLLVFIFVVVSLVVFCRKGKVEGNKYGESPLLVVQTDQGTSLVHSQYHRSSIMQGGLDLMGTLIGWLFGLAAAAAWFTHLYVCFTDERWGFLIAGAIFFPIAIVHGIGLWFGIW